MYWLYFLNSFDVHQTVSMYDWVSTVINEWSCSIFLILVGHYQAYMSLMAINGLTCSLLTTLIKFSISYLGCPTQCLPMLNCSLFLFKLMLLCPLYVLFTSPLCHCYIFISPAPTLPLHRQCYSPCFTLLLLLSLIYIYMYQFMPCTLIALILPWLVLNSCMHIYIYIWKLTASTFWSHLCCMYMAYQYLFRPHICLINMLYHCVTELSSLITHIWAHCHAWSHVCLHVHQWIVLWIYFIIVLLAVIPYIYIYLNIYVSLA